MKYIILIIKKLVVSLCTIYTINVLINKSGISIPINIYSIFSTSIFGLPAILGIMVLKIILM